MLKIAAREMTILQHDINHWFLPICHNQINYSHEMTRKGHCWIFVDGFGHCSKAGFQNDVSMLEGQPLAFHWQTFKKRFKFQRKTAEKTLLNHLMVVIGLKEASRRQLWMMTKTDRKWNEIRWPINSHQ